MITILDPVTAPTESTTELNMNDDDTCYICQGTSTSECHYCDRPICDDYLIELPRWCLYHLDACPKCQARKQEEGV